MMNGLEVQEVKNWEWSEVKFFVGMCVLLSIIVM